MTEITWGGWIAPVRWLPLWYQKWRLRTLGVRGKMIHNSSMNAIEYCSCDTATMERLRKNWRVFWPMSFTGIDNDGNQLPKEEQKYWKLEK